ncbi:DUF1028 domain-containing protein [Robbsia sp. KACC 23696]|uniref:DUF1028 domain-containing protein n=1 Tax=Robbsia sp. KACC 23696 TaxID=3149231 RepID=UPI00325BB31A
MTFSLLGHCRRTGEFGAVVTTSSPCVGARVPFLSAGLGGVLTQHRTDPRLGPRGLDLMRSGCSSTEAIAALVASSPAHEWRQMAAIDAQGRTASFTGASNRPVVAEAHGDGCVAIGNILHQAGVVQAMIDAFGGSDEKCLAQRLMAALEAGEAAGGEGRPLQSAALVVVAADPFPWLDLRIDLSDSPLPDLRRLLETFLPSAGLYRTRALTPELL